MACVEHCSEVRLVETAIRIDRTDIAVGRAYVSTFHYFVAKMVDIIFSGFSWHGRIYNLFQISEEIGRDRSLASRRAGAFTWLPGLTKTSWGALEASR
jgi:hypothetical protein